jgi:uncharacterized protein DUF927
MTNQRMDGNVTEPHIDEGAESVPEIDPEKIVAERRLGAWTKRCPAIPEGCIVPTGWEIDEFGIHKIVDRRSGDSVSVRVAYGPVLPVATHVDPDGAQLVDLWWHDGRRWINRLVPRAVARSGKKLVAAVGGAGLPVTESGGKDLENWLAAFESLNRRLIPECRVARTLGWQSDGSFVFSSGKPHRVEPAYEVQGAAVEAHRAHGTLEAWQAGMRLIEPFPVAKMCLYGAFGAPLLRILGVHSFTMDVSGRSTRGKSTAGRLPLSAWADPSDRGGGMFSWRTTMMAAEQRLNICNGLPVLIDETRAVNNPKIVDDLLYQIPMNHGSPRGGGWPSLLPWHVIVISTGEQSALSFLTHQGAAARTLTIQQAPFGAGNEDNARAAAEVSQCIDENYGVAGPAFATRLIKVLKDGGEADLREQHRKFTEAFRGGSDMSGRRAPLVAALALAAKLAHSWNLLPFTLPANDVWVDLFLREDATDNRPEMALDVCREFVAGHSNALWEPGMVAEHNQPLTGWIGRKFQVKTDDKTQNTIALLPEKLREALKRANYDLAAVLPGWEESGTLMSFGKGRTPYLPTRALGSTKVRMYVFAPGTFTSLDGADDDD